MTAAAKTQSVVPEVWNTRRRCGYELAQRPVHGAEALGVCMQRSRDLPSLVSLPKKLHREPEDPIVFYLELLLCYLFLAAALLVGKLLGPNHPAHPLCRNTGTCWNGWQPRRANPNWGFTNIHVLRVPPQLLTSKCLQGLNCVTYGVLKLLQESSHAD